ncbi:MAG: site-specific integrase [Fibromonadaceae bacterium]|jgi:integrase|nr:site-specific integrase [Fibromonadaceae bacterium]
MATIDIRFGQIKDRTVGYKPMHYCVGNKSKKFLQACLKAHEIIMDVLTPQARASITPKEAKAAVLAYVAMDEAGKKELIKKIALSGYGLKNEVESATLEELANAWLEQRVAQGATEQQKKIAMQQRQVFLDFFTKTGMEKVTDLKPDTAHKFLAWRSETNYGNNGGTTTSASVLRLNLQILRQMVKIAARNGWIANQGIWDDVKVKSIAGVNTKTVEPLPVDLQRNFLEKLKGMKVELHDSVLLLLLTGMRIGELESLSLESIRGNAIVLHGEAVGTAKPLSGKSAAAARTLPVCPSVAKIFERGYIFCAGRIRQTIQCDWFKKKFPGIHAHRLRHTFAVNKLLSKTADLQMVSYQLGHGDISLTANLYGKFVPEHFKVGFEEAIKERKELLDWLENGYFHEKKPFKNP